MHASARLAVVVVFAPVASCRGVDMPVAPSAWLQVENARYVDEAMPAPTGGPELTAVESTNNSVRPGQRGAHIAGRTDGRGYAIAFALDDVRGYWIAPVGLRSALFPGEIEWDAALDFAPSLPPGRHTLRLVAIDGDERFGPPATVDLDALSLLPNAALVVSLAWDADADLNLWVETPDGLRLSRRGLRDADDRLVEVDATNGPILDADSNARCTLDGRRAENALWGAPAPGHYVVRVETWSLCSVSHTGWQITVRSSGTTLTEAHGSSYAIESTTTGSALVAAEFDVPP